MIFHQLEFAIIILTHHWSYEKKVMERLKITEHKKYFFLLFVTPYE